MLLISSDGTMMKGITLIIELIRRNPESARGKSKKKTCRKNELSVLLMFS